MSITLVLGGARSGKSSYAESLAKDPRYYIATAQAFDEEMRERIAKHQMQRGKNWTTYDAPLDLVDTIKHADQPRSFILVDCITLWLSNILMEELDWEREVENLVMELGAIKADIVIVSNEVGLGIVPDNKLSRIFRDAQGIANQAIAEIAETVVLMTAGIPLVLKGKLPERRKTPRAGG